MRFATYSTNNLEPRFGFKKENFIVDIIYSAQWIEEKYGDSKYSGLPSSLKEALKNWDSNFQKCKELDNLLITKDLASITKEGHPIAFLESEVNLLAPVHNPQSFRDFYAFEQHVRSARKLRGLEMHPDWFRIPIFYFSNASALYGHKTPLPYPRGTNELDFELEFAIIIANGGKNIGQNNADSFIAGYTICNDWSARELQREE